MSGAEWGEAHQREAMRRIFEIAAIVSATNPMRALRIVLNPGYDAEVEVRYRKAMAQAGRNVAREMRRLHGLAEGRLVRSVTWRGESGEEYTVREDARADKSHGGGPLTWISRIRRAP